MSGRRWTAKEDDVVRTYPTKAAIVLLKKGRTAVAVRDRRRKLKGTLTPGCWVCRPWTPPEDEIVRSNSIKIAIGLLAEKRTEIAVRLRRKSIGAAVPKNLWTKIEDHRIRRTALLPLAKVVKLFKNRTPIAISARRSDLGCQQKRGPINAWKGVEVRLLRQMWPTRKFRDIANAIPRHNIEGIRGKAAALGLLKLKTFGGTDLLDQIKARAYEDGISQLRLAAELGFGKSFLVRRPNQRYNFNRMAAAAAFFGGRLVIDWQDE